MSIISSIILGHDKNLLNPTVTQYDCSVKLEKNAPSKISASQQMLFIEQMTGHQ